MERVEVLKALPGCCYLCRSSNRESYIDTRQSIDLFGAVYICCECVILMGREMAMITAHDFVGIQARNKRLEEDLWDANTKISGLEQAIDGLRIAGRSVGVSPELSADVPLHSVDEGSSQPKDELGIGEGASPEPSDDKGVAELSNDDTPSFSFNLTGI